MDILPCSRPYLDVHALLIAELFCRPFSGKAFSWGKRAGEWPEKRLNKLIGGGRGKGAGRQLLVHEQHSLAFSLDHAQFADDVLDGFFLFHLFTDKPVQENIRSEVLFLLGEADQVIERRVTSCSWDSVSSNISRMLDQLAAGHRWTTW